MTNEKPYRIRIMTYCTWDIECGTRVAFKRKGSPFHPGNWVVTHGWKRKGDTHVTEVRFGHDRPPAGWLGPVLVDTKLLVGQNIKFDLLHAIQDPANLELWMAWVAAGGQVWDIQLAEYLLCGMGQKDQMLSLDELAPRYGGNVKVDEVKALWAAGVMTEDIEPALLTRYLCGGLDEFDVWQKGDVENTELVFLAQVQRAREAGQLNSILLNMGSLLCTIEMERNGMYVDKPLGLSIAAEVATEIDRLQEQLNSHLPATPFEFNWGSTKQKSALIFGGTINWDAYQYDTADGGTIFKHEYDVLTEAERPKLKYAQKDELHYVLEDGTTMECLWYEHLCNTEWLIEGNRREGQYAAVYKAGKQAGEKKTKKVKVDDHTKPKGRGCKAPYVFARKTAPKRAWESAEPGFWSTSNDVIEELGVRGIPFLKDLSALASATKDLQSYYIYTNKHGETKGMLSLVGDDGIIHHSINHTSTVTGRFSSSDPNLQNIPKGNKSKVKTVFVSRFGADGQIIQSDFSSLEIYVQAILTNCRQLIDDLKAGLDMHCLRLANTEGKPYHEVLKLCKGDKETGEKAIPEWDYKRTDSKVYSFQAAYGAGDAKIADTTGMPIERVAALRAADDARYPEIPKYFQARTLEIKKNRKPLGITVPHPDMPGVMCNLGYSSVRTPDGKLYSYQETPSPEFMAKKGHHVGFSPTEIKNYEVQGEGGEWAKAAMWIAIRAFYERRNFGGLALLVNQVHDALYADAHGGAAKEAATLLHACMEAASEMMEYLFTWKVPVPVPSDTSMGPSMMDDEGIKGIRELARPVRLQLRKDYMNGYVPSFEKETA